MKNIVYVVLKYNSPLTGYTIKERFKYRYEKKLSDNIINEKLNPKTIKSYASDTIYIGRSLRELYKRFNNRAVTLLDYHVLVR